MLYPLTFASLSLTGKHPSLQPAFSPLIFLWISLCRSTSFKATPFSFQTDAFCFPTRISYATTFFHCEQRSTCHDSPIVQNTFNAFVDSWSYRLIKPEVQLTWALRRLCCEVIDFGRSQGPVFSFPPSSQGRVQIFIHSSLQYPNWDCYE